MEHAKASELDNYQSRLSTGNRQVTLDNQFHFTVRPLTYGMMIAAETGKNTALDMVRCALVESSIESVVFAQESFNGTEYRVATFESVASLPGAIVGALAEVARRVSCLDKANAVRIDFMDAV